MLKTTSVRDMVRGECLAPGLNMFSATFFVKCLQAVGADAPLLMVPREKCSGPALGSPVSPLCLIQTHPFAGRTEGRHKFVHESSAGLPPKPEEVNQRCPVGAGHD